MIKYGDVEEEGVYLDRFLAWMSKWMAVPFVNYGYGLVLRMGAVMNLVWGNPIRDIQEVGYYRSQVSIKT